MSVPEQDPTSVVLDQLMAECSGSSAEEISCAVLQSLEKLPPGVSMKIRQVLGMVWDHSSPTCEPLPPEVPHTPFSGSSVLQTVSSSSGDQTEVCFRQASAEAMLLAEKQPDSQDGEIAENTAARQESQRPAGRQPRPDTQVSGYLVWLLTTILMFPTMPDCNIPHNT